MVFQGSSRKVSFEVLLERSSEGSKIIIQNKKGYLNQSQFTYFAELELVDNLDQEQLLDFSQNSVRHIWEATSKSLRTLDHFLNNVLNGFLKSRGYVVKKVERSYSSDFESPILLFLYSESNRNLIQLYIYNINEQQIGVQSVSLQRIQELKLSSENIGESFK